MEFEQRFKESGRLIQENNDKSGEKYLYFGMLQGRSMRFVDKQINIWGEESRIPQSYLVQVTVRIVIIIRKKVVKSRYGKKNLNLCILHSNAY